MSLIERLRRSYVDHGTNYVQEAADALELAYEMLDHLCIGAVECNEEIERLTAERDAAVECAAQEARYNNALRAEIAENGEHLRYVEGQETLRCAEVRGLTAERDALAADAARWNFATSHDDWAVCKYAGKIGLVNEWEPIMNYAAIDAAIQGAKT